MESDSRWCWDGPKEGKRLRHTHWITLAACFWLLGSAGAAPDTLPVDLRTLTAEELYSRAYDQQRKDPRLAQELARYALDKAAGSDQMEVRCRILSTLGVAHYYLGEYSEALQNYQASLALAEELGNLELSANALNNIGILHFVWGEHDRALEFYFRAIALRMKQNDRDGLALGYNNVANVQQTAGNYDQALENYRNALGLHMELGNEDMVAATHNNLGLLQYDMERYQISKDHFETALVIERKNQDTPGMALSLNNLGQVLEAEGQLDDALESYRQALAIREELEDRQGVSVCLHNIGSVLAAKGNLPEAITYLERALALAKELKVQELIRDDLLGLSRAHALAGDHEKALVYHQRYKEAHDEIFTRDRAQQMAMAETRFQVGLKDQEIEALTREKEIEEFRRQILLVVAALSLGILLLLLNRYLFQKGAHGAIRQANQALQEAHADLAQASRDQLAHVARVATMGELAAAFAHELNQPLAAIKVNARAGSNFLDRENPDPEETLAALEDIGSDAERAQQIIRRLRRMMRKGEIRRESLDIEEVATSAASFLDSEFGKTVVALEWAFSGDLPEVRGDRIQLQQVVLNLLQNALAVAEGTTEAKVKVATALEGDMVVLEVSDSGPLVEDEVFSDLFEPFFTTKQEGLGMGLPICRTIMETHGGTITARRNQGTGLTLRLTLPVG